MFLIPNNQSNFNTICVRSYDSVRDVAIERVIFVHGEHGA